jgi:hypothetical protein
MSFKDSRKVSYYRYILPICLIVFIYQTFSLANDQTPRSGDSLYTLILADNIARGKGYGLNAIMHHHKKYAGGTWVVDCFRAPFGSLFFAPLMLVVGKNAFWPNLITAGLSSFVLPFLAFLISIEVFGNKKRAFWAAVITALHPTYIEFSMSSTYDMLGTVLAVAGVLFFLKSLRKPSYLITSGIVWGFAYLAKESYVIILPILIVSTLWLVVFRKRMTLPPKFWLHTVIAMILFGFVIFPWYYRCHNIPYEHKLTKVPVATICGFYNINLRYGDKIPLWWRDAEVNFSDRFTQTPFKKLILTTARNWITGMHHLFVNVFIPGDSEIKYDPDLSTSYYGIPFATLLELERIVHRGSYHVVQDEAANNSHNIWAAIQLALSSMTFAGIIDTVLGKTVLTGIIGFFSLMAFWKFRREPKVMLLGALIFFFISALSLLTFTYIRYLLMFYVFLSVLANEYVWRRWGHIPKALGIVAGISLLIGYYFIYAGWHFPPEGSFNAVKKQKRLVRIEAAWYIAEHTPEEGTVVLCDAAVWMNFYSSRASVTIPYSPNSARQLDVILDVITQYDITHVVIPDDLTFNGQLFEPLRDVVKNNGKWLTFVASLRGSRIYAIKKAYLP